MSYKRTVERQLRDDYTPKTMQMGSNNIRTEMAISQTLQAIEAGCTWMAVLDLKSAYDNVGRDLHLEIRRCHLPEHMTSMTSQLLQTLHMETINDKRKKTGRINKGVTQGGPLRPDLFNMFIDTLAYELDTNLSIPGHHSSAKLYADDAMFHLSGLCDLQHGLLIYSDWATSYGMKWSLSKEKSQALLNDSRATRFKSFPFAGREIYSVKKAKYLGVMISADGTMEESLTRRMKAAHVTMTSLVRQKMLFPEVDSRFATMLFRSMLQSNIDYACFLHPSGAVQKNACDPLLRRFFPCALGIHMKTSQLPRLIFMFKLDTFSARRRALAHSFMSRLKRL